MKFEFNDFVILITSRKVFRTQKTCKKKGQKLCLLFLRAYKINTAIGKQNIERKQKWLRCCNSVEERCRFFILNTPDDGYERNFFLALWLMFFFAVYTPNYYTVNKFQLKMLLVQVILLRFRRIVILTRRKKT